MAKGNAPLFLGWPGAIVLGLFSTVGCGGKSTAEAEEPREIVCSQEGTTYRTGESFPDEDGCNTCTCQSDGAIACTARACGVLSCESRGVTYPSGTGFTNRDDCNFCFCGETGVSCTPIGCGRGCTSGGRLYAPGESFPAEDDDCNTCYCGLNGLPSCTLVKCIPPDCAYLGRPHAPGQVFPARDGCNTCTCLPDGSVTCTEDACRCNPENEWWRRYVAGAQEKCAAIDIGCPPETTVFHNDCGCGCEQSARCAESMICSGEGCLRCPFSVPR